MIRGASGLHKSYSIGAVWIPVDHQVLSSFSLCSCRVETLGLGLFLSSPTSLLLLSSFFPLVVNNNFSPKNWCSHLLLLLFLASFTVLTCFFYCVWGRGWGGKGPRKSSSGDTQTHGLSPCLSGHCPSHGESCSSPHCDRGAKKAGLLWK